MAYGRRSAARKAERIIGILALTGMLAYSCMLDTWGPLLAAAVMCIILYGVDFLLGRMRPSRKENWVLQITGGIGSVYVMLVIAAVLLSVPVENHETSGVPDLSLRPEDYRASYGEPVRESSDSESSVLGSRAVMRMTYGTETEEGTDRIIYFIWRSEYPWVIERIWDIQTRGRYPSVCCEDAWDARDAWGVGEYEKKNYYIRYDDAVFVIYGEDLSEQETVDAIRQKLKLG